MNKTELLDLVLNTLQKEEAILIAAGLAAQEAATESEAKPENEYDTRGLEQSYLAAGQAKRAEALKNAIVTLKALPLHAFDESSPIDISALVALQSEEHDQKFYFILPSHGGIKLNYMGKEIFTLSPESPLGKNIIGKLAHDSIEVNLAGQPRLFSIVSVN